MVFPKVMLRIQQRSNQCERSKNDAVSLIEIKDKQIIRHEMLKAKVDLHISFFILGVTWRKRIQSNNNNNNDYDNTKRDAFSLPLSLYLSLTVCVLCQS